MHDKVTARKRMCVPMNYNYELQNGTVTLIFEVGTWLLDATHGLDVADVYAK
jgi:hypothetical protein